MKKYQIFITNNTTDGGMKSFSFSSKHIKLALAAVLLSILALGVITFDYSLAVFRQEQVKELRTENRELNRHLNLIKGKVQLLEANVHKVEDFSLKLKVITNREFAVSDSAIGPLPFHDKNSRSTRSNQMWETSPESSVVSPTLDQKKTEVKSKPSATLKETSLLDSNSSFEKHLHSLIDKTQTLQRDIWLTIGSIEEKKHLLAVTPSMLPVRGRVTSRFGYRGDTALPLFADTDASFHSIAHFHKGIDVAAPIGTSIQAPADGVVVMTGYDSMTGNYIYINHGYNLNTLYAHLENVEVDAFTPVKRGDVIGTVGNTGRSTGPHLHYEVRIDGQSVNPEYFAFDF